MSSSILATTIKAGDVIEIGNHTWRRWPDGTSKTYVYGVRHTPNGVFIDTELNGIDADERERFTRVG